MKPRPLAPRFSRTLVALVAAFSSPAAPALAPAMPAHAAAAARDGQSHQHTWVKQSRKEWVPPVTRRVQVGVDSNGRPIFETQIVQPGYWKVVRLSVCSCGATRG
jgi:hypothetical protein